MKEKKPAPGKPGDPPHWTTGAKTAVGTAVSLQSRIWFTIAHGMLNEIYFPTIDQANLRAARFLVADGHHFFSDEESDAEHSVEPLRPDVPAFRVVTRCKRDAYRIEKEILADPHRDTLLMRVEFEPRSGEAKPKLYIVADPHIADCGAHNDGWVGVYKGVPMLFASRAATAMAIACSAGFEAMSCGYVGRSDGCTDLQQHKRMEWRYTEAEDGNISLIGGFGEETRNFVLAFGFGTHAAQAAQQARAGLLESFDAIRAEYLDTWRKNQRVYIGLRGPRRNGSDLYRVSTAVLQTHESKRFPGATVAGLSVPWGFDRGDQDIGGYHAIWPRDMVQAAMGKLACGDVVSARRAWFYLVCTQEEQGNWTQNMWLDGTPNWTSIQMDATAHSILLADALRRARKLEDEPAWEAVKKAAGFLVRNGPLTQQERWEENAGYSPNTMAIEVAALLAAADFAEHRKEAGMPEFLRATADAWNEAIDELTYATGTELARKSGVEGYYIRISPPEVIETGLQEATKIKLKNLPEAQADKRAVEVIGPDALTLVRFGLRAPGDPRIEATVKLVDELTKREISNGPVWHRYTGDGYGEAPDGSPFRSVGQGRGWPLLAGERAHFEIARGNLAEAKRLAGVIASQTSECGLIPEQVWDDNDIPERELFNGRPTGSGMPLVWAHAEFIKLLRSIREKKVWDMPPQPVERYQKQKTEASFQIWTKEQRRGHLRAGKDLRIDLPEPARVRWSTDGWGTFNEDETTDSKLGMHYAVLAVRNAAQGARIQFTFCWTGSGQWEGQNYEVLVG